MGSTPTESNCRTDLREPSQSPPLDQSGEALAPAPYPPRLVRQNCYDFMAPGSSHCSSTSRSASSP